MFDDAVTVVQFPTVRDRGRDVPDLAADPTSGVELVGVDVQPGASTELVAQRRDATLIRWTVWIPAAVVPAGMVITDASIVRFRGLLYQVDGDPQVWLTGAPLDHLIVLLKAWKQ